MKSMMFNKRILTVSLIVMVAVVLVYFLVMKKEKEPSAEESAQRASESQAKLEGMPIPVRVTNTQRGDLFITLKSPGEAVTDRKIIMKAEVPGVLKSLRVEESQHVKEGDLLVELDDREYQLELERYEAERLKNLSELLLEKQFAEPAEPLSRSVDKKMKEDKVEYEKARQLFRQGKMSEKEFEDAYNKYELALIESGGKKEEIMAAAKGLTQAEINVKKARMNLEKTKIIAPFSGIIFDIKVSPQEHVTSVEELFTLVNIRRIQVQAKVLESEIGKMRVGREANLRFSAYSERVFKGRVKAISPIVNPEDKTCKVMIDMANPQEEIKPGMHAEVEIVTEIYRDRLIIPLEAILTRGGRKLVFVVENGLAKWRYIQVGLENEDFAEVLESEREGEGIKAGDRVIIEGHFTLAHDANVRVIE